MIQELIATHRMTRFGVRIGVAVSGGADSVFLLRALVDLGLATAVLHVNHKLRDQDSDADEAFVRQLAVDLGLPIHVAVLPPPEGNTEQEARRARYAFFEEIVASRAVDAVATGHTLDDQAETVLTRFLRGSGTAGLRGILPVTDNRIIRPLLGLRRADIRSRLTEQGIPWREDRSNQDTDFLRNHLRLDLMPRLEAINPNLAETLASTATLAQDEEAYWESEIDRLVPVHITRHQNAVLLQTGPFNEHPPAIQRRLLRSAFAMVRGDLRRIDFAHVEAVRALVTANEGSGRIQLPGLDVFRSFDWLRIDTPRWGGELPRNFEADLAVPGTVQLPERGLSLQIELVTEPNVYNDCRNTLAGEFVGGLIVRNWQPGDQYWPVEASAAVKIKTLFQEGRVPLWERRTWPVLVQGDRIVWTRRFGVAREFAAAKDARTLYRVTENSELEVTESK